MILQLNPPLPLRTPKGDGWAHLVIDYGQEHHLIWVVFLNDGGQCWAIANPDVTMDLNWTMGRNASG